MLLDVTGGNDHGLPLGKRHPNTYLHFISTYTLPAVNERTREVWQSLTAYLGTVSLIAVHQILRWIDVGLYFAYYITFLFQRRCIEDSLPSRVTTFSTEKVLATLCELWNTSFIQWWHFFICEKVRESKLSCGCEVHILLATSLMVLTWLDCCGAFEDGNVFSEEEVEGGCFVWSWD